MTISKNVLNNTLDVSVFDFDNSRVIGYVTYHPRYDCWMANGRLFRGVTRAYACVRDEYYHKLAEDCTKEERKNGADSNNG